MLEQLLMLDALGIIAPDMAEEANYINAGNLILEASANFEIFEEITERIKEGSGVSIDGKSLIPYPVLHDIEKTFNADLSWVPAVSGVSGDPTIKAVTAKVGITYSGMYVHLPLIINISGSFGVLFHECIHTIRHFTNNHNNAFEEAFASYGIDNPSHGMFNDLEITAEKYAIDTARKKLENAIGDNAPYALIRMSRQETYDLFFSESPMEYLRGLNLLRHRIVKEKLGI